jgi:hypothetical protein
VDDYSASLEGLLTCGTSEREGTIMSTDDSWIITRVAEARASSSLVTEAVSTRVEELLTEKLTDHSLTQKELRDLAVALIADMAHDRKQKDLE